MNMDYITGRVLDAHFEGKVRFSKEEEEDFRTLLKKELNYEELTKEENNRLEKYKKEIIDSCDLVLDWYDIEDTGEYHWEDCLDD
jgi:hypothetical protein